MRWISKFLKITEKSSRTWFKVLTVIQSYGIEIVTVLSKGQLAILKMAAIRPYNYDDWPESFSGRYIKTLKGNHVQDFDIFFFFFL